MCVVQGANPAFIRVLLLRGRMQVNPLLTPPSSCAPWKCNRTCTDQHAGVCMSPVQCLLTCPCQECQVFITLCAVLCYDPSSARCVVDEPNQVPMHLSNERRTMKLNIGNRIALNTADTSSGPMQYTPLSGVVPVDGKYCILLPCCSLVQLHVFHTCRGW